jgi:hypothetical protein
MGAPVRTDSAAGPSGKVVGAPKNSILGPRAKRLALADEELVQLGRFDRLEQAGEAVSERGDDLPHERDAGQVAADEDGALASSQRRVQVLESAHIDQAQQLVPTERRQGERVPVVQGATSEDGADFAARRRSVEDVAQVVPDGSARARVREVPERARDATHQQGDRARHTCGESARDGEERDQRADAKLVTNDQLQSAMMVGPR